MIVLLAFGLTVSASVLGTVVGLLLITLTLRLSRRLSSLHRRLLRARARLPGRGAVEVPARTGLLGRLDRRLRDRVAWRGVWYSLIKLPVAFVQLYTVVFIAFGLIDLSYPVIWPLFHNPRPATRWPGGRCSTRSRPAGPPHHHLPGHPPAAFAVGMAVVPRPWLAKLYQRCRPAA